MRISDWSSDVCSSDLPREVIKAAIGYNAAAVIMSHNHPSGQTEPSQADIALTRHLKEGLALIDVRVLDHIIVAADKTTSMAERRSEERRVGKECVSTCTSRWSTYH